MPPKRKATSPASSSKRVKHEDNDLKPQDDNGTRDTFIDRRFYPAEMSASRCASYTNNQRPRPMAQLTSALQSTASQRAAIQPGACVVHWFKRDLRIHDNRGLAKASACAKEAGVPLVCAFLVSPKDYEAHVVSARKVDFELRSLAVVRADLERLDIPLYTATIEEREAVPTHIVEKAQEWGAKHVFCNIEYEVDELRRETGLVEQCLEAGIDFTAVHDDAIVAPGALKSGSGSQYAVFTPWYKNWAKHLAAHPYLLAASDPPAKNPSTARKTFSHIFDIPLPVAPPNKALDKDERDRMSSLYPAGEHEAHARLERFVKKRIAEYKTTRDIPALHATSLLSPHLAAGTLSARDAVRVAQSSSSKFSETDVMAGPQGPTVWISEVAWRDFYMHVLAHWPYVCMSVPFKPVTTKIEWDWSTSLFTAWREGRTGYPLVDAAMRQLAQTGWMHNRARMVVASFLAKDLLLDWRLGERHFMLQLIDGDFASNNGGWGFAASVGVDPQPYFRIFNPLLQSEKFDTDGAYIRKWVPELKDVQGKAIHDPYARGAAGQARKAGYPERCVDHKTAREKALERYKAVLKAPA